MGNCIDEPSYKKNNAKSVTTRNRITISSVRRAKCERANDKRTNITPTYEETSTVLRARITFLPVLPRRLHTGPSSCIPHPACRGQRLLGLADPTEPVHREPQLERRRFPDTRRTWHQ